MSNIYFFGDTHGELEIQKVFNVAFDFKAEDYAILNSPHTKEIKNYQKSL